MPATILTQRETVDGYRMTVRTAGRDYPLHFRSVPTQQKITDTIDTFERQLLDTIAADVVIESEELLEPETVTDGI